MGAEERRPEFMTVRELRMTVVDLVAKASSADLLRAYALLASSRSAAKVLPLRRPPPATE